MKCRGSDRSTEIRSIARSFHVLLLRGGSQAASHELNVYLHDSDSIKLLCVASHPRATLDCMRLGSNDFACLTRPSLASGRLAAALGWSCANDPAKRRRRRGAEGCRRRPWSRLLTAGRAAVLGSPKTSETGTGRASVMPQDASGCQSQSPEICAGEAHEGFRA